MTVPLLVVGAGGDQDALRTASRQGWDVRVVDLAEVRGALEGATRALALVALEDDDESRRRAANDAGVAVVRAAGLDEAVERAGPPPDSVAGIVVGPSYVWAGRTIVDVPQLNALTESVTRCRVLVHARDSSMRAEVVRRRAHPAALVPADGAVIPPIAWVTIVPDRRPIRPPKDLADALGDDVALVAELTRAEQRHLVSMVREAKDPATRQSRIDDAVAFLRRRVRA